MNAKEFKQKVSANKKFSRVLIAKNYDTASFNYRGIGRFQVRFSRKTHGINLSIYLNGNSLHMATYDKITLQDIVYHLDLNIDNNVDLYNRSSFKDE